MDRNASQQCRKGTGMLHNITKPRPWRGGAEVIEDVFEDAQPLKKVDIKRQDGEITSRWTHQSK